MSQLQATVDLQNHLEQMATARGYDSAEHMKSNMTNQAYAHLVASLANLTTPRVQTNAPKTIRVYLVMDPTTQVFVKTTEQNVRAKLKGIRKDIINQKFSRWAPFAGLMEATGDGKGGKIQQPSWTWEFVDA